MSWAEIKKAVNSDLSTPLNEKINTINKSTLMAQAASIDFSKIYPNSNLIINNFNKVFTGTLAETTLLNVNTKGKIRNLTVYMKNYGNSSNISNVNFNLYINGIKKINFTLKGRVNTGGSSNPPQYGYALLGFITDLSRIKFNGGVSGGVYYDTIVFKPTSEYSSATTVILPSEELVPGKIYTNSAIRVYYFDQFETTELDPQYYTYTSGNYTYYDDVLMSGLKIIDEPLEFNNMSLSIAASEYNRANNAFYVDVQYELD